MNVGIMGGTFDPIHIGHLIAADRAREEAGLDEVWFMPSGVPPHKTGDGITAAEDRLEMVRLAIGSHPAFQLNNYEIKRGNVSYTIDTVRWLREHHPEHRFFWIIGADMIEYLPKWYQIDELLKLISFIGLKRPGYESALEELPENIRASVRMIEAPLMEISSTELRERLANGHSVKYTLPQAVESYIKEHHLFHS